MKRPITAAVLFTSSFCLLPLQPALAEDTAYGSQLMTEQERAEHRARMRSMKTEQERETYRYEHHQRMQKRAREQGITLPEEPPPRGKGMQGYGRGGTGQGMGGAGRGR